MRNPNMIGQIANCPKCGSMILIAAPQKITVDSGNPTDSVAVTREALPTPDEDVLNNPGIFETGFRVDGLPPTPPSSHPRNVDLAHSLPPDDEYRLAADADTESEKSSDAMPLGAWLPDPDTADPLPPPRSTDTTRAFKPCEPSARKAAAKSRHVMLVATIGLCSILIAIGILVVFLRWINKSDNVALNKPPAPPKQSGQDRPARSARRRPRTTSHRNNINATPGEARCPVTVPTIIWPTTIQPPTPALISHRILLLRAMTLCLPMIRMQTHRTSGNGPGRTGDRP